MRGLPTDSRERIVAANIVNQNNPYHGTPGGNNTFDKVFLLSIEEVNRYFKGDADRVAYGRDGRAGFWWLRSPGISSYIAAYVSDGGNVDDYGYVSVIGRGVSDAHGVRPALWIQI
jgi:hypothetical protein